MATLISETDEKFFSDCLTNRIRCAIHASAKPMRSLTDIRAVTFDAGGTLIEPWPSVGHVYAEVAEQHGHKGISAAVLDRRFVAAWRAKSNFDYSRAAWAGLLDRTFAGLVEGSSGKTFFPELYRRFATPDVWRLHADVLPTLETLKRRGLTLGIISNWDERLRPLLKALQLGRYFQAIIISCEVGFLKPFPGIFQRAIEKLDLPAHSVLHVGDSRREDVLGARSAGLRALLINRHVSKRKNEIATLDELADLLVEIGPPKALNKPA